MRKVSTLIAAVCLLFVGCTEKKNTTEPACDFEQKSLLTNYAEEFIIPAFQQLSNNTSTLLSATAALEGNINESNLLATREALTSTYISFQSTLPYIFGPAITPEFKFSDRINTFPANTALIEQNIANGQTNVAENFTTSVGFAAIEYLLYGLKEDNLSNEDIITLFQNDANRLTYLKNAAEYANLLATNVSTEWQDTYADEFIENTGASEGSSLALLANEVNFSFETLRNFKLKIPVGLFNSGVPQPEKSEGYNAEIGLQLLKAHTTFFVEMFEGSNGYGLKDYCNCLDPEMNESLLGDDILSKLKNVESKILQLQGTLPENLENNQQAIVDLVDEMQLIIPLLKREMTNLMGVRIAYTDNDGD